MREHCRGASQRVANLLDASYLGPIGTGGFTVSGDNQTLQAGPRRLVFLSLGTTF
jgi:hypothetical protein